MDNTQLADTGNQRIINRFINNRNSLIQRHAAHVQLLLRTAGLRHKHLVRIISRSVLAEALALLRLISRMRRLRLRQQALRRRHGHLQNAHLHRNLVALHIGNHAVLAQRNHKNIQALLRRLCGQRCALRQRCILAQRLVELLACLLCCLLQALRIEVSLHRAQLLEHSLALAAAAAINIVRLLACLAQHLVFLTLKLTLRISQRITQLLALAAQVFNLLATALIATTLAVQLLQHIFHMHMLLVQQLACIFNYILSQTKAAADIERITAAGHAHQQAVRRTQRHRIKLHARVLHTLMAISKGFQLAIVRRHHRQHALLMQMLQHCHRQRRALVRVRTGADFVDKHQIAGLHLIKNAD